MKSVAIAAAGIGLSLFIGSAAAQSGRSTSSARDYPNKTIRMIVPFPAGGPTDVLARAVALKLNDQMGQPVVIDNRGGASGMIGADIVAKAAPDGYTILMGLVNTQIINSFLYSKVPYDPIRDFAPITKTGAATIMFVAHPSLGVKSIKDFIAAAKAKPRQLNFGSPGTGLPHHLAGELLKTMAGIDIIHLPYKGAAPAVADLLGAQINTALVSLPAAYPHVKAGKLVALGVTSRVRSSVAPEVPTFAEQGLGGYDLENWYGLFAPARTPTAIIAKLNQETVKALTAPDAIERLNAQGFEVRTSTPAEFADYIKAESGKWSAIVKASGAKAE